MRSSLRNIYYTSVLPEASELPDNYKKVEDTLFVRLTKVGIGFARLACGKGDFLNPLMQMRSIATLKKADKDKQLFDDCNADDSRRIK